MNFYLPLLITQHLGDTTQITYQSGCEVFIYPLRNFYFHLVATDYVDMKCYKLSTAQIVLSNQQMVERK
ncbi:MAG: hypothetical protein AAGA10_09830 [Bacteroidota bacterium]